MPMNIVFANCMSVTAQAAATSTITTDPVALGDNDRATCEFQTHYVWQQLNVTTVSYQIQVSNDGTTWVNVTGAAASLTNANVRTDTFANVLGAFVRIVFSVSNGGAAGTLAGTAFDLHVYFDHT